MSAPECRECRWLYCGSEICKNLNVRELFVTHARLENGDCGPAGRYWEPREEEK